LCNKFIKATTEELHCYYLFFETRYKSSQLLSAERPKLQELNVQLADGKKTKVNKPKSLRAYYFRQLIKLLSELGKNNVCSNNA
jgi:hypothetical protein